MSELKVGQEVLVRGRVKFLYADGIVQVQFSRKDPLNRQLAHVEPDSVLAAQPLTPNAGEALSWRTLADAITKHKPEMASRMSLAELTYITRDLNVALAASPAPKSEGPK